MLFSACGGGAPHEINRTLRGHVVRGAFVPPSAYEAYVRGELLLDQGRAAEAVAQLELAATAPDEDDYLLSRLAYAQLLSGDRAEAERTLERASQLDACSEAVWLMRGTLAETTQELAVARAAYEKASSCAPSSPAGELALARLFAQHGEAAAALDVLVAAAQRPDGDPQVTAAALRKSLQTADAVTLAHAFASLSLERAAGAAALEQAIGLALDRELPRLALRLYDQHATRVPTALEARLFSANHLTPRLAALIGSNDANALGGHASTAQLALEARAYERAELEAASALQLGGSDAMRAVRARALLALGHAQAALSDVREIREPKLQRTLLEEALAAVGRPALAHELHAQPQ